VPGPGTYMPNDKYKDIPEPCSGRNLPWAPTREFTAGCDPDDGPGSERGGVPGQYGGVPDHGGRAGAGREATGECWPRCRAGVRPFAGAPGGVTGPDRTDSPSWPVLQPARLGLRGGPAAPGQSGSHPRLHGAPEADATFFVSPPVSLCSFCQSDADWPQTSRSCTSGRGCPVRPSISSRWPVSSS
jgi:hypothetical protein